jgi:hypothetical protein
MAKFRKKPVVIEARRLHCPDYDELCEIVRWCGGEAIGDEFPGGQGVVAIRTLEGTMVGECGDWIIKGVKGEFYPCKPDIFAATYEAVE